MKKQFSIILFLVILSGFNILLAESNKPVKWLVKPQYQYATSFSEGLALVVVDNKGGFINKKGEIVIEPQYAFAKSFSEGLAAVTNEAGETGYINTKGKYVIKPRILGKANEFKNGLALIFLTGLKAGAYEFIDKKGKTIFSGVQYNGAYSESMSEGLTWFIENGKYGFINNKGKVVIKPRFDMAALFKNGFALTSVDANCCYINTKGEAVIPIPSCYAGDFSEGLALCRSGNKPDDLFGYVNKKGEFVITPGFDDGFAFSEGLACVKKDNKYGFITRDGREAIKVQYDLAYSFTEGLALVGTGRIGDNKFTGKIGFIDKEGNLVIKEQFEDAYPFSEGIAAVQKDGMWGYIFNPMSTQTQENSLENAGLLIGNVRSVSSSEIIVGGSNIAEKISMGDKVCIYSEGNIIILQATFPMQTVTKCEVISGNIRDIKPGMKVYKYSVTMK